MTETTAAKYKFRNLHVKEERFGRIATVDRESLVDDGIVLNDAIKLAAAKGGHTLFYEGKSVYVKPFKYQPATLAKALDEA